MHGNGCCTCSIPDLLSSLWIADHTAAVSLTWRCAGIAISPTTETTRNSQEQCFMAQPQITPGILWTQPLETCNNKSQIPCYNLGTYPTRYQQIADTAASRIVCRRMFIVFLERMAPAHNCRTTIQLAVSQFDLDSAGRDRCCLAVRQQCATRTRQRWCLAYRRVQAITNTCKRVTTSP